MKAANKLKEGLAERIKDRVQKLKNRKGHNYFLSNLTYPENEKQKTKHQLQQAAASLEEKMPEIKTIITLAKDGRNVEIMELARSGHESLDLAFLFLEEGQEERLKSWFEGKIIDNKTARETLHKVLNSGELNSTELPVYDNKTDVYGIYSLYTHSSDRKS